MSQLLHFQFYKLYKKTIVYILLALLFYETLSTLGNLYKIGTNDLSFSLSVLGMYYSGSTYLTTKDVISSCFSAQDFIVTLLLGIFIGTFVTEDRVKGTIKTIYSKGYSRVKIFFSKYMAVLSVPALFYLLILITSWAGALVMGTGTNSEMYSLYFENVDFPSFLIFTFLRYIAVSTLYFMISELVNSTGGAIALNIFTPYIVFMILSLLAYLFRFNDKIVEFITNIASDFILATTGYVTIRPTGSGMTEAIISAAVLIVLFGGLSLLITVKKQVKN